MTLIVNDVVEEVVKDDMAHGTQAFREEWQTGRPCMYKDSLVFVRANLTPPNLDSTNSFTHVPDAHMPFMLLNASSLKKFPRS